MVCDMAGKSLRWFIRAISVSFISRALDVMFSPAFLLFPALQSVAASYRFPLIKCPSISNYNNTMHCFKK
jgi:hypothetical protein